MTNKFDPDIDNADALRKQIGTLSADRDCLRYLLRKEKEQSSKTVAELQATNGALTLRLEALAALVARLKRPP